MKDLPIDVLKNIVSYTLGKPEYVKIKYNHIEPLERIQRRYKIHRTEPEIRTRILTKREGEQIKQQAFEYHVSRKVPLSVESIKHILMKEADEIDCLLDDDENEYMKEFKIFVDVSLRIRWKHFTYDEDENEFSSADCEFDSDRDCIYTLEFLEDIDYAMGVAVEVLHNEIDKLKNKGEILGINNIRLHLLIWEPVE